MVLMVFVVETIRISAMVSIVFFSAGLLLGDIIWTHKSEQCILVSHEQAGYPTPKCPNALCTCGTFWTWQKFHPGFNHRFVIRDF